MKRVKVYIDGFNLYHAIDRIGDLRLKWISYRTLAQSFLRPDEQLSGVTMFTAIWTFDQAKQFRHKNFIAAQRHYGVTVIEGSFVKPDKYCSSHERYCPFREEKQTDVGIAIEIAKDVLTGAVDRVILITADSDQIPTAKLVHSIPGVDITLYAPPNRMQEARELGKLIPDRNEISVGRLLTCKLPRDIIDSEGRTVATCPAIYGLF